MWRRCALIVIWIAMLGGGCDTSPRESKAVKKAFTGDAREVLENADQFEVISLNPDLLAVGNDALGKDEFYGRLVLGRTMVKDRARQREIVSAIYAGIARGDEPKACFEPRHAVRAVRGGSVIEIVICFECSQADVYVRGARSNVATSAAAKEILDKVLREAGVPLAKSNLGAEK